MKLWFKKDKKKIFLFSGLLFIQIFVFADEVVEEVESSVQEEASQETAIHDVAPNEDVTTGEDTTASGSETQDEAVSEEKAQDDDVAQDASADATTIKSDVGVGLVQEETPEQQVIVITEALQPLFKECSASITTMNQNLIHASRLCDGARAELRAVDKLLDGFYEEMGGKLGALVAHGERLKIHITQKEKIFKKQSYEVAHQGIDTLNVLMRELTVYQDGIEKVKVTQKEIDLLEDEMRKNIKILENEFFKLTKLVDEADAARDGITTAPDEAHAQELSKKVAAKFTAFTAQNKLLQEGAIKENRRLAEKINEQIKSLKEESNALTLKITELQKSFDAIALPGADIQEDAKEAFEQAEVPTKALPEKAPEPKIKEHKKIKIEQKSLVRLSMESIWSAFSDVFGGIRECVKTIVVRLFGPQKSIETSAVVSKEKSADKEVRDVSKNTAVSLDEKIELLNKMKQERSEQLKKIKEIHKDLETKGIEVKDVGQEEESVFSLLKKAAYSMYKSVTDTLRAWLTPKSARDEDLKKDETEPSESSKLVLEESKVDIVQDAQEVEIKKEEELQKTASDLEAKEVHEESLEPALEDKKEASIQEVEPEEEPAVMPEENSTEVVVEPEETIVERAAEPAVEQKITPEDTVTEVTAESEEESQETESLEEEPEKNNIEVS